MDLKLSGKAALVTGGTRGIGLAIAQALVAEGVAVSVCGRDAETLEKAVRTLRETGAEACGVRADVTDPDQLRSAVDISADHLGGLDMLVANAGGVSGGDLLESTPEDWSKTYMVNVGHAAHAIRCAVPYFERREGGSVVIISSITGWKPGPKASYAAAKAAEIHLAAVLAEELASRNVRVNAVSPGSVLFDGGGWEEFSLKHPEQMEKFTREECPAGHLLTREEVADVTCFLLSERAYGINGTNVRVDGAQGRPNARRLFLDESAGLKEPAGQKA